MIELKKNNISQSQSNELLKITQAYPLQLSFYLNLFTSLFFLVISSLLIFYFSVSTNNNFLFTITFVFIGGLLVYLFLLFFYRSLNKDRLKILEPSMIIRKFRNMIISGVTIAVLLILISQINSKSKIFIDSMLIFIWFLLFFSNIFATITREHHTIFYSENNSFGANLHS